MKARKASDRIEIASLRAQLQGALEREREANIRAAHWAREVGRLRRGEQQVSTPTGCPMHGDVCPVILHATSSQVSGVPGP